MLKEAIARRGTDTPAMPAQSELVSVRLLYPFAAALRDEGVELDPLLAIAEIAHRIYDNEDSRIPYTTVRRFHHAAAEKSRDPALGLAAARHYALAQFQALEYFVASSTHMGAALQEVVEHEPVVSDVRVLSLESRTEGLLLRVQPAAPGAHRCWFEFVVGALYLAGRRIRGASPGVRERQTAWFAYPRPDCATAYEAFFQGLVRFDAPADGLLIPSPAVDVRPESANPRLRELLQMHLENSGRQVSSRSSFLDRVSALVAEALPEGDPSMDAIAAKLHMSRSTLRRRLGMEGTTHRRILRRCKEAIALQYLQRGDLTLGEVAYLAGYKDSTSFHKAFKQWTGSTPAEHRTRGPSRAQKA
jgi:AraC-like DNA-binding protein